MTRLQETKYHEAYYIRSMCEIKKKIKNKKKKFKKALYFFNVITTIINN